MALSTSSGWTKARNTHIRVALPGEHHLAVIVTQVLQHDSCMYVCLCICVPVSCVCARVRVCVRASVRMCACMYPLPACLPAVVACKREVVLIRHIMPDTVCVPLHDSTCHCL